MATNPAGGTAYGDLTGARESVLVQPVSGARRASDIAPNQTGLVAMTVAQAGAIAADQTVEDLLNFINTAIAGERNTTAKTATTGTMGLASSAEN